MIRPVPIKRAFSFPATTGVALAAIGVTLWFWSDRSIDMLVMHPSVWPFQPWRLLTSALPHGDVLHLGFNVYWLWTLGGRLEQRHGSVRTFGFYLATAAGSAAAEYALLQGGIGLSGVGYALVGFMAVAYRGDPKLVDAMDRDTVILFAVWFFICIAATVTGVWHIANVAHGMGAVLGILLGLAVYGGERRPFYSALSLAALVLCLLASSVFRPLVQLDRWMPSSGPEADLRSIVEGD